jgi:hypothetical protein
VTTYIFGNPVWQLGVSNNRLVGLKRLSMITSTEIAGAYSIGFSIGYFDIQDIVNWADNQIKGSDNPSHSFIELSLCSGKHSLDILHTLKELYGNKIPPKSHEIVTALIARDYANGGIPEEQLAEYLDRLGYTLDEGHWPEMIKNAKDSKARETIRYRLIKFLKPYESLANELDGKSPTIFCT